MPSFPADFLFGAATSAYQIEGASRSGGRGESIWDRFIRRRSKIKAHPHSPSVAADHYHRYLEDIALAQSLGVRAYRLSISWSRVLPNGTGEINPEGIAFYKNLVQTVRAAGMAPWVTLFHWDLPQALQDQGGLLRREIAQDFVRYTEVVVAALSPEVQNWITLNEPWEFTFFGHCAGWHAPGLKRPWAFMRVMHHLLLCHASAVTTIRRIAPQAQVGITLSQTPIHAATQRPADQRAAAFGNAFFNRVTLDPILRGHYPPLLVKRFKWFWPKIEDKDMASIAAPLDFVGINNYQREKVGAAWWIPLLRARMVPHRAPPEQCTAMGWEIYPPCLHEVLSLLREEYGNPPVYITENGAAFEDVVTLTRGATGEIEKRVHDPRRIAYLESYLGSVSKAIAEGANVRGYFVWSLLDNFEWAESFHKRFGLIYVDYPSLERVVKDSAFWYRDLIARVRTQHISS